MDRPFLGINVPRGDWSGPTLVDQWYFALELCFKNSVRAHADWVATSRHTQHFTSHCLRVCSVPPKGHRLQSNNTTISHHRDGYEIDPPRSHQQNARTRFVCIYIILWTRNGHRLLCVFVCIGAEKKGVIIIAARNTLWLEQHSRKTGREWPLHDGYMRDTCKKPVFCVYNVYVCVCLCDPGQ